MNDKTTDPKSPAVSGSEPGSLPAAKPEEAMAVLLKHEASLPPGRVVRGTPAKIDALIKAGKARKATAQDLGIAGGRSVALR